jgi:hypothetical protein
MHFLNQLKSVKGNWSVTSGYVKRGWITKINRMEEKVVSISSKLMLYFKPHQRETLYPSLFFNYPSPGSCAG